MHRDALSATLNLFDAEAVYAGGLIAGGDWAIRFPPPSEVKFFAIGRGGCLLAADGHAPVRLAEGDVFLLRERVPFTIGSDLGLPPLDAIELFAGRTGSLTRVGSGEDLMFLGSHIRMSSASGRALMENLPWSIHLTARDSGAGQLHWLIGELVAEAYASRPGAGIACTHLAQLMFLQILRAHLAQGGGLDVGWLRLACDARLAPALRLMQDDPARRWSLNELARAAAMSRTAFATHFKATAGVPPLTYLTAWRMRLAERRLGAGGDSVAAIARAVGYESEAAFSTAFKRVMGRSPRRGRRELAAETA